MKKILALALILVIALSFAGCSSGKGEVGKSAFATDRWIVLSVDRGHSWTERLLCDTETGVLYGVASGPYQLAVWPILDRDGTPMLYEEYVPTHFHEIGKYADPPAA